MASMPMGRSRILQANWFNYPQYYDIAFQAYTKCDADFIEAACRKYCRFNVRRFLEPACGSGRLMTELAARGYQVTGFDLSQPALRYLRRRLRRRRLDAEMFAAEGGKVAFCGRRTDRGAQVESNIKAEGGEAKYIRADVRIEDDVRRFVDTAAELYGGFDICFNNAGITIERPLHEYTAAEWDDVVNTDLRGNFLALKYEIPYLIKRGGGVIVVTASSNAIATTPKRSAYSAAKRGLVGMVQAAAQDYADNNIRINTLIPGTTDTEFVRRAAGMMNAPDPVWQAAVSVWAKSNVAVAHRLARPEEIAATASQGTAMSPA